MKARWWQLVLLFALVACDGGRDRVVVSPSESATAAAMSSAIPDNGWWWNPAESGRGFALERQGTKIFLAGFMYEGSGSSTWYTNALDQQADGSYAGQWLKFTQGQTLLGAYQAPANTVAATVRVSFTSGTQGRIDVTPADGSPPVALAIERYPISQPTPFVASSASFQSGWWYSAAESGRGYFVEVQGTQFFMAAFMYEASGQPIWYASGGRLNVSGGFTATLAQYTGGQTLGGAYQAPTTLPGSVGDLGWRFDSPTSATLTLPDGQTRALTRYSFNSETPTGTPLPAATPYTVMQEFDLANPSLHVQVQSRANFDYPMVSPQVNIVVTNTGKTALANLNIVAMVSKGGVAAGQANTQPPRLFLQPGESQWLHAILGENTLSSSLPPTPTTWQLNWTVGGLALATTPVVVTNWSGYFLNPATPLAADVAQTVSGQVVDVNGAPINATVELGAGAVLRDTIRSSATGVGQFRFTVPKGTSWVLRATKAGYRATHMFLDPGQASSGLRLVLVPHTGPRFTYGAAVTKETANAFWQGTVSADEQQVLLTPGMEAWPNNPGAPAMADQKVMLYGTDGVKRWAVSSGGSDAWGSDLSADGKWAVYASHPNASPPQGARIVLLDAGNGSTVWSRDMNTYATDYPGLPTDSQEVRFSPDGRYIVVGEGTGYVRALNRSDGSEVWKVFLKGPVRSVRMSGDGQSLYVVSAAYITARLRLSDGAILWSKNTTSSWAHQTGLKESPDGRLLAVMSCEGIVNVHDAATGAVRWTWDFQAMGHWAGFSADSQVLVVSTLNGTWAVLADSGARVAAIDGSQGGSFAKGQSWFVVPSNGRSVGVYDLWGTLVSNPITGLDWSDPNYYFGWMSSDGSRLVFAKNYATSTSTPVLFFVSGGLTP